jgi:hypothetical protein
MPHQIEYPVSHERKVDIQNSQRAVKIKNDSLNVTEWVGFHFFMALSNEWT